MPSILEELADLDRVLTQADTGGDAKMTESKRLQRTYRYWTEDREASWASTLRLSRSIYR